MHRFTCSSSKVTTPKIAEAKIPTICQPQEISPIGNPQKALMGFNLVMLYLLCISSELHKDPTTQRGASNSPIGGRRGHHLAHK